MSDIFIIYTESFWNSWGMNTVKTILHALKIFLIQINSSCNFAFLYLFEVPSCDQEIALRLYLGLHIYHIVVSF